MLPDDYIFYGNVTMILILYFLADCQAALLRDDLQIPLR
jgi:hypothetical protein